MPLFRFHRGGLEESLATTRIVKDIYELRKVIEHDWHSWPSTNNKNFRIEIEAYPSFRDCFDGRIGWYIQLVTANIVEEDKMHPIGFLSEPFE